MKELKILFGFLLIIVGIIIIKFGHKKLNVKKGIVLKILEYGKVPDWHYKVRAWGMGLILIFLGLLLLGIVK